MMPRSPDQPASLPATIRRQIRSKANVSYLQSLPAFRVDEELPSDIQQMLNAIDAAAAKKSSGREQ
ncbi:hypothetical protein GA830_05480 [Mesorhizobium sp. NBSH29]|uniref:hypothetical protein n=1 Tax=Mesorhizobium sp. NBSH29 TaxID=2654249 RepID=UPI0018967225|nr:hypothetical protein [Mesorhizobium sp. NBSH29]QPC86252.1 hypothetical protein GA830_05480 [Mesorhizobium sp. NBSH29]